MAKKHPKVKVNRKSCSVSIYGFQKNFKVGPFDSLSSVASKATSLVEKAEEIWTSLGKMSKILSSTCIFVTLRHCCLVTVI